MPKATRRKITAHPPPVPIRKRAFAVDDNQVKHLEVGESAHIPADVLLAAENVDSTREQMSKKDKQQLKTVAFLERLKASHSPYSKSHQRRIKRRAKEQLANGMEEIQAVLDSIDASHGEAATEEDVESNAAGVAQRQRNAPAPGVIGEGKGSTLSKAQRKRALKLEQLRHPLILSNPHFASNPFQTIRTHAENTLLQHKVPE